MREVKRVAKNTGFLYARMAITVFISLYSTRLVLKALGAEDFGLFSVVAGTIAMLTFFNNAMTGATQRFMSYAQGEGNYEKQIHIFNVSIILHIIVAFAVVALLEMAGYFLFDGILQISPDRIRVAKLIFQLMIFSTFFTIISVPYNAVINARENMLLVAILGVAEAILKLCIAITINYTSYDKLVVYGSLMVILTIILLVVRGFYCHIKYEEVKIGIKKYFELNIFREMTGFAGWNLMGCTSSMLGGYGQGIVLNMFFGTAVNAAQGVANQVSGQLSAFASTMIKALNPMIGKSEGANNRSLTIKASMVGSKVSFFLLMFTFIPVLVEMPYVFSLWLKDVPEFAIIFCRLLLLRNLVEQMYTTLTAAIAAVGNIKKFQMVVSFFYFLPIVVSYYVFKLDFPAYYLYIVFLIFSLLTAVVVIYFAKVICTLPVLEFIKDVVFRSFVSFVMIFCLSYIPTYFLDPGILRLLSVSVIAFLSFVVIVWRIGFTLEERSGTVQIFNDAIDKVSLKYWNRS